MQVVSSVAAEEMSNLVEVLSLLVLFCFGKFFPRLCVRCRGASFNGILIRRLLRLAASLW